MNIKLGLIIAFCLIKSNTIFSQELAIKYLGTSNGKVSNFELSISDSITIWKNIDNDNSHPHRDMFVIKKKYEDIILFNEILFNKTFYIKDSLNNMKWELRDETKEFLGKTCHSARTLFRGREYIAYYSNEFINTEGPWKFGGLPGLILDIHSTDGDYLFSALNMTSKSNIKIKEINISNLNFINWSNYEKEFISTIDKVVKMLKAQLSNGDIANYKIDGKEIIYQKAQMGNGIIIE